MGFTPCRADMDVWRRAAKKGNGDRYYEYLFVYTDDVISIAEDPDTILKTLDSHFLLKPMATVLTRGQLDQWSI